MPEVPSRNDERLLTQTLFANGYLLVNARRTDDALVLTYERTDRLGVVVRSEFLISAENKTAPISHF